MFSETTVLDLGAFKATYVTLGEREYSFGRLENLDEHLAMISQEFSGKTQLELFHAVTTVFIRRGINLELTIHNFKTMWEQDADFLCENLDTRWLVSACDTIIDTFSDPIETSTAATGVLFMNTIKLYETERKSNEIPNERLDGHYPSKRRSLFDGMSCYTRGGDMIANMLKRLDTTPKAPVASRILSELIERAYKFDTIFNRFETIRTKKHS